MIIETREQFYSNLHSTNIFNNDIINLDGHVLKIQNMRSEWITFESCTFNCDSLNFADIYSEELILEFKNCTFNCSISFSNCKFERLTFLNTKFIRELSLSKGLDDNNSLHLNIFTFSNELYNDIGLNTKFSFKNCQFKEIFTFKNINQNFGTFDFIENILGQENENFSNTSFNDCFLYNARFIRNKFISYTRFNDVTFSYLSSENLEQTFFFKNIFWKVSFSKSIFIDKIIFSNCDFLSTTWFEECKNLTTSKLKFVACEFKGFSLFNNSNINSLDIDRCTFGKSTSFTDAEFNSLKLFEVKFEKGAYFDEMIINDVLTKNYLKGNDKEVLGWKRTLRAIKQELQKTENKIDFNKFRSYELEAHYEKLNYKQNFKDVAILWSTKISTDFGSSWTKAFWFTIIYGIGFYLIFYLTENYNHNIDIQNCENWTRFSSGLFRFFLVTDFFNPLESDRIYLTNPLSWLIFILGKIVIAFGIYEIIQSFRKFKS